MSPPREHNKNNASGKRYWNKSYSTVFMLYSKQNLLKVERVVPGFWRVSGLLRMKHHQWSREQGDHLLTASKDKVKGFLHKKIMFTKPNVMDRVWYRYTASYLSLLRFPLQTQQNNLEGLLNYSWCCLLQPVTVLPGEPMAGGHSYQKCDTPASHQVAALYYYWFPPLQTP